MGYKALQIKEAVLIGTLISIFKVQTVDLNR
jgi:hypothetical protein